MSLEAAPLAVNSCLFLVTLAAAKLVVPPLEQASASLSLLVLDSCLQQEQVSSFETRQVRAIAMAKSS